VLQGNLLMSEADLTRLYPEVNGTRAFLIRTPPVASDRVMSLLEDRFGDEGFDAVRSHDRLAELLAVQNTYLSTFQSLGLLGLLLGTFGLATVQLRNVLERRGELALLRAEGFRPARLAVLVTWENALLLACGLGIGAATALLAILPQLISGGAGVPWTMLLTMLALVLAAGLLSGLAAVWSALNEPILSALRAE
jgi:ABC-type antimicrobial peptide transport system permease subunit